LIENSIVDSVKTTAIGLTSPTVGDGLFVSCTVKKSTKSMLLLWPAMLIVLLLTIYAPWITMALPNWLMP
jgi:TRAP-type C4-dicarboxylate transport system permease large subunit